VALFGMPLNLLFVRHFPSEGNLYYRARRDGFEIEIPDEFKTRPSSDWRLIDEAIAQAEAVRAWIRGEFGIFHRAYTSTDVRALETSGLLGIDDLIIDGLWADYARQSERSWGMYGYGSSESAQAYIDYSPVLKRDPLRTAALGGESHYDLFSRAGYPLYAKLQREYSLCNVIVVCHGEIMWMHLFELTRMTPEHFKALHASKDPKDQIHNGQVLQFTRRNPLTGHIAPFFTHLRSICPWDVTLSRNDWQEIVYKKYTSQELLQRATSVPRLINRKL
jgi:NAD+ kinase